MSRRRSIAPTLVAAAALAALGLALIFLPAHDPGQGSHPAESPTPSASASHSSSPVAAPSTTSAPALPDAGAQLRVARRFASAYGSGEPAQRWLQDLAPLVSPQLLDGFRYTDPRLLPHGAATVYPDNEDPGRFLASYACGEQIALALAPSGDDWVVDNLAPVSP